MAQKKNLLLRSGPQGRVSKDARYWSQHSRRRNAARCVALALAMLTLDAAAARAQNPEAATPREHHHPTVAPHDMVVAAHPLAAAAGRDILRAGGNAVDAAIATALVLNLVEPQSSGLGGGGFLVFYSAARRKVDTIDGRETAPLAAKPDRFLNPDGTPMKFFTAVVGGRSIGTPGYLRMLELAHRKYGKLAWARLFAPAIKLATDGFPVSDRLHMLAAEDPYLRQSPSAKGYFYHAAGTPLAVGEIVKNPALARVFTELATRGADAFYTGAIAQDMVRAIHAAVPAGDTSLDDLARYRAKEREPVCAPYRAYRVCGMGPPSSGGITLLEILGMLQRFPPARLDLDAPGAVHLFAEAGKLAFADRERYLADTDFVPAPVAGLLDPHYLAERAALIDPDRDSGTPALPGEPPQRHAALGDDTSPELPSTSDLAVIDRDGNAVSMTVSIENQFGSRVMVDGFLLNNELTDFSFLPERDGRPVTNRVAPGKRPRSAMSPTLVFDARGLILVVGSAGGPAIIEDVGKSIIAALDEHLDLQAALDLPDIGDRNGGYVEIEAGRGAAALAAALEARGHHVRVAPHPSGLAGIEVTPQGLEGAADSRRDGTGAGD
jgi:gamma-glutamyltranspeptidase/glutathione hydrolase